MVDRDRERALKADLTGQGGDDPPFVSAERFFDGNDDPGSIGCNLIEHPGIETFRDVLLGLTRRADVDAVYAQVAEIDPGEGCWPFADTVFIAGSISPDELARLLSPLQPDEVHDVEGVDVPVRIVQAHPGPLRYAWWD